MAAKTPPLRAGAPDGTPARRSQRQSLTEARDRSRRGVAWAMRRARATQLHAGQRSPTAIAPAYKDWRGRDRRIRQADRAGEGGRDGPKGGDVDSTFDASAI